MTILPKKKSVKEKNESENADHSQLPHGHNPANEASRASRRTSSPPPRWNSPTPREDILNTHDPTALREDYAPHENGTGHKRRHRSPPHRTICRKHSHNNSNSYRGHERGTTHTREPSHTPSASTHAHSHRHDTRHASLRSAAASASTESVYLEELDDLNSGYNSGDEYVPSKHPDDEEEQLERWFTKALKDKRKFVIKKMNEDGACLFRAVADHVFGDQDMHTVVRRNCVDYMAKNEDFFKQYVTEDFNTYLNRKRMNHTHGNHIEIQALSELYNRPIEVYQYSTEPINTFHGAYKTDNDPIRLSYHRNIHYNSVVNPSKATVGVGLGLPGYQPGLADKNLMSDAIRKSEELQLEQTMLEDKMRETDWEVTQETIEEQVARESYLQWLRDQEKRAKQHNSPRSASATCSSADDSQTAWWDTIASPARSPDDPRKPSRSPRHHMTSVETSPGAPSASGSGTQNASPPHPGCGAPMSPAMSSTSTAGQATVSLEGAVGGVQFDETTSLMNDLPPQMFGLSQWDEDDILAQVMAQSQQEYLDSLRKNASAPSDS
ncbi:hypothetical protein NP493_323g06075 [Ridgeia piscesae]|uniref:ubiquitinyl hydrolase 1 n=1 Tax=Ridgeia piscesae TaxID=27915 RepID=A0AAD9L4J1_RIDPI|nr:hypothetical protein NP493_323g06075 [Ridgeia piscesae]